MNIFILDTSPKISASLHCDQHLHKMILESAQMLSTLASVVSPTLHSTGKYYKPTHLNHPCNYWLRRAVNNANYLIDLCYELDNIRQTQGCASHKSMEVVVQFEMDFPHYSGSVLPSEDSFIFCGPVHLQYNSSLTVPQKYQAFYRLKKSEWESEGRKMTWNGRAIPEFMNGDSK